MKPLTPERQNRLHLLIAGISSTLVSALLLWSFSAISTARQLQQQASEKIRQSEQRQRQSLSEMAEIARLQPLYQQLQAQGLGQPASAPVRAGILLALQKSLQLPSLHYEFQPPQLLPAANTVQHHFVSQTLKLHLDLIHEEDLLHFLEELTRSSPALIITRHCQLARPDTTALAADCQIDWFSLDAAQ